MKRATAPAVLLVLLCAAYLLQIFWASEQLPEMVATRFGFNGYPVAWMTRSAATWFMGGLGIGLALLFVFLSLALRFMPLNAINMPNREHWLSPQHREETLAFITRQMLWLDCLVVAFLAVLLWFIVEANNRTPIRMPPVWIFASLAGFLVCMEAWAINFIRRFRSPIGHGKAGTSS
jgi:uncharacterized membrane protein